jgi:hypothetical protein
MNIELAAKISRLTAYQSFVYINLIDKCVPPYSPERAIDLIESHKPMIKERERRKFEPLATARAIQEVDSVGRVTENDRLTRFGTLRLRPITVQVMTSENTEDPGLE